VIIVRSPRAAIGVARIAFLLVAVGLLAWAVLARRAEIIEALHRIHPWTVAVVVAACMAAVACALAGWRVLLADLGWPLSLHTSALVFFVSQLGKYVPGGIWQFVAVMSLAAEHDVPRQVSLLASTVLAVVTLLAALVVAAVTLPALSHDVATVWWPLLLALPVVAVIVHPRVVNASVAAALRWTGRGQLERPLSTRAVLGSLGWTLASFAVLGVGPWALLVDLGHGGVRSYLVATGAFALAWAAGLIVVFAPAGAGVREGVLVLALGAVVSRPDALLVALVLRAATAAADLILAGGSMLSDRWVRRASRLGPRAGH
jgi:glycosyltransferase 2 family protein